GNAAIGERGGEGGAREFVSKDEKSSSNNSRRDQTRRANYPRGLSEPHEVKAQSLLREAMCERLGWRGGPKEKRARFVLFLMKLQFFDK
ncbi:hypothetical protein CEXT_558141, partial [Caerostris extrusa]